MKPINCLALGCLAIWLLHPPCAQAEPDDFSDAKVAEHVQKLAADDVGDRKSAMAFMETWATSEPEKACCAMPTSPKSASDV